MAARRFDPHRSAPRHVACVSTLADDPFEIELASAAPHGRAMAFKMLTKFHRAFDPAHEFGKHAFAVEQSDPAQVKCIELHNIENVIDEPVRAAFNFQLFFESMKV
jgi:hypothetical protein